MDHQKLDGKMLQTFTAMIDFKDVIYVNSHVQLRDPEEMPTFDKSIKMHAAVIETVDRKAKEMIEEHTYNEAEQKDATRFYLECIASVVKETTDGELIQILKKRNLTDASDNPLGGIAGVVESARVLIEAMGDFGYNSPNSPVREELKNLRLKLKEIGIEE